MIKPTELQNPSKLTNPYKGKGLPSKAPVEGGSAPAQATNAPSSAANAADPASKVELSEAAKAKAAEAQNAASSSSSSSSESSISKLKDKLKKSPIKDAPIPTPDLPKKAPKPEAAKKPVLEAEKKGHLKLPAIIFIPGVEIFSDTGSSASYGGIRKMAESVTGARIYGWDQDDEIIEQIKKIDKDQPVILIGHSFGGDTAHEVAEELNTLENGFRKVDLLVTLDSIGIGNDIVPSNVKRNLNIFSEKDMWLNDGPHVAREFTKTKVMNILRPEKHTDLDDTREVQKEIIDAIGEILKGHGREKVASGLLVMDGDKTEKSENKEEAPKVAPQENKEELASEN